MSMTTTQETTPVFYSLPENTDINTVDWGYVSRYQKLSEKFIEEHKGLVDWGYVSQYQQLSEKFIKEHKDLVDWNKIATHQKISEYWWC